MASVAALTRRRLLEPNSFDGDRGDRRAKRAAETGAATDETEETLGLPGVVDVVGQRPELADEQHPENLPEEIERDGDPDGAGAQQCPEDARAAAARTACVIGITYWRGSRRIAPLYKCISTPMRTDDASRTYGRLSDPSWSMNFDLVTGLRTLCDVIARNE